MCSFGIIVACSPRRAGRARGPDTPLTGETPVASRAPATMRQTQHRPESPEDVIQRRTRGPVKVVTAPLARRSR